MKQLLKILFTPSVSLGLIVLISLFSLGAAFFAEAILKLEPCILCIYQRYPFALALALSLVGLGFRKNTKLVKGILAINGLSFLANSVVASYHTGVEHGWWSSHVDGCAVPLFEDNSGQSILENIMSAPMGDCSKIPWQDPLLGLSMANYNVLLCFGLFVFCIAAALKLREPSTGS